jgi:hypothetical protein
MTKFSIHMAARMSINMRSKLTQALNMHLYATMDFMLDRFRSELRQAVRLSPDNAAWHYRLFNAYVREKEPAQADLELKTLKTFPAKSKNQGEGMDSPARELEPQQLLQVSRGKCHSVNR